MAGLESIDVQIEQIISLDPGGRGVGSLLVAGDLAAAADELMRARRVWILTGFVIPALKTGETDGPPGAISLASGLLRLGIPTTIVTDPLNGAIMDRSGLSEVEFPLPELLRKERPTHVVAIERPGRAMDGRFHTMDGRIISLEDEVASLFDRASAEEGIVTIGIGDGGNEIGMGKVFERVVRSIPHGERIASVVSADRLIVAGTSNWGAWGLLASLSIRASTDLLPADEVARNDVTRFVAAGGVDGRTGRSEASVDGLGMDEYLAVLRELRMLINDSRATESIE
jgi:hypothetical protein